MKKQTNYTCNKTKLAVAILLALGPATVNAALVEIGGGKNNFTMLDPGGGRVGGTNDVVIMWDGTLNTSVETAITNMTVSSSTPFFGTKWNASGVQVFGTGTYTFEACPGPIDPVTGKAADGSLGCSGGSSPLTMVVGNGQVGVHMLFAWNGSVNIDVVNVWDMNSVWGFAPNDGSTASYLEGQDLGCFTGGKGGDPSSPECTRLFATEWLFASTDVNGDGIPGSGMVDGPFVGFNANFNVSPVPVPAAVWLMGSGLLGLAGVASRRKKRYGA